MCVITSAGWGDETDDFARPDGEDGYGPSYEVSEFPAEMREVLDDQGRYTIPLFINRTIRRGEQECWVIDQIPAAGTEVTCPQTVEVQLKYTCDGEDEFWARLPIELIDVTPPEIALSLDASHDPHVSFGGVLRYPAHAVVLPTVDAVDPCGVQKDVFLNGEPYQPGTPIVGTGLQILTVHAEDPSTNVADETIIFEIRERPSLFASAVVESTQCTFNADDEIESISVTVLIASSEFHHRDILLSSVRLMLVGADGLWLHLEPIGIKNAFVGESRILNHDGVEAVIEECSLRATFEADFSGAPLAECPVFLDVLGVGHDEGVLTFEWGAHTANLAVPDPYQALGDEVVPYEPCDFEPCDPLDETCGPPDPEPPVPCQAVETFWIGPNACTVFTPAGAPCAPGSGGRSRAQVTMAIGGSSVSVANVGAAPGPPGPMTVTCATPNSQCGIITGNALLLVDFVGNCCNCSVTYTANASVSPSAQVIGSWTTSDGLATAGGSISSFTLCGQASATSTASINGLGDDTPPDANLVPGPVACTVTGCVPSGMAIRTTALVSTSATATNGPAGTATTTARATLTSSVSSIDASPTFQQCEPCEEDDCGPVQPEE